MAQNLRKVIVGELFFLVGMGIALIGSGLVFLNTLIYYLTVIVGLVVALYGAYVVVIEGILTGIEYRAVQVFYWMLLLILTGVGFYFIPFVFGLPVLYSVDGTTTFFPLSLTFMYAGLLQNGIAIFGIGLLIPDIIRQAKMKPSERYRLRGQVQSYKALVTTPSENKKPEMYQEDSNA